MSSAVHEHFRLESLDTISDSDIRDIKGLVEILPTPPEPELVPANLLRSVDSTTTDVFAIRRREEGTIVATATLNRLPILSDRGSRMWIDDVATDPNTQGKGLSRLIMNAAEAHASQNSNEAFLTSSPECGPARAGYHKRGYELYPRGLYVFRNVNLNNEPVENTQLLDEYSEADVESMAMLLQLNPEDLEGNLQAVIASTYSAAFARKHRGVTKAVAVANLGPIPSGFKPWIDNLAGATTADQQAVIAESERWIAQSGGPYSNIVAISGEDLGQDYQRRATGLFIKQLVNDEAQ